MTGVSGSPSSLKERTPPSYTPHPPAQFTAKVQGSSSSVSTRDSSRPQIASADSERAAHWLTGFFWSWSAAAAHLHRSLRLIPPPSHPQIYLWVYGVGWGVWMGAAWTSSSADVSCCCLEAIGPKKVVGYEGVWSKLHRRAAKTRCLIGHTEATLPGRYRALDLGSFVSSVEWLRVVL